MPRHALPSPPTARRLTRRGLLAGLAATAVLTACTPPWDRSTSQGPVQPIDPGSTPEPGDSADVTLLRSTITEVAAALALVTDSPEAAVATTMAGALRPVHTEHLAALRGAEPSAAASASATPAPPTHSTAPSVLPKAPAARATILAAENAHLTALTTAAAAAESGAFARLLTSMAAGLAQRLTVTSPEHPLPPRSLAAPVLTTTAPDADTLPAATVTALQALLAGQHAALYVVGVLAGRAKAGHPDALRDSLRRSWNHHRELRDQTEALVRSVGVTPEAAAPEYTMPGPFVSAAQLRQTALGVQQRCTAVAADLVGHAEVGPVRTWAIALTNESAVRELSFGGNPVTFPGAA